MGVFGRSRLEAHQVFAQHLDRNPYYPFTKVDDARFHYKTRYTRFWFSLGLLLMSIGLLVIFLSVEYVDGDFFFLPIATIIFSLALVWTYKDTRTYVLDGRSKTYAFFLGKRLVISADYHNVYIRLRKRFDSSGKPYFYLILNGFKMDRQILTGVTPKAYEMRKLGKRLAERLGINYFDEGNVSRQHVVRHFPDTASVAANNAMPKYSTATATAAS